MNWKKRYRRLEDRVMLDAAGAVTVADAEVQDDAQEAARDELRQEQEELNNLVAALGESQDNADTGPVAEETGHEILFVDSQVEDVQQLLANLSEDVEVFFIEADEDGVAFIADVLANSDNNYSAVHIVSHGDAGELRLGSSTLTQDSLIGEQLSHVQSWGEAITEDGDILIYGCSVAEGEQGLAFIDELASVTGADIAASIDDTGDAAQGGDWDLEVSAGEVEAEIAISEGSQASWGNLLALNVQNRTDLGGGAAADEALAAMFSGDGSGVNIDQVTYVGDDRAVGTFEDLRWGATNELLMSSGLTLTTGLTTALVPDGDAAGTSESNDLGGTHDHPLTSINPATGADPEVMELVTSAENQTPSILVSTRIEDVNALSFSFTPDAGVTKLAFAFAYSTEETYEYAVNQPYADLFGVYGTTVESTGAWNELEFTNLRALYQGEGGVVFHDNSPFDSDPENTEQNRITAVLESQVALADFGTLQSGSDSYEIKFVVADQGDSALNSASFFDYFGSSIRLDLDADDSTAAGFGYQTSFDTTAGAPTPVGIIDADGVVANYDQTFVTNITIDLTNSSGTDTLAFGAAANVSVTSSSASQIVLTWTAPAGFDPTDATDRASNIADIEAALNQVTYTNSDGAGTNATPRAIEVVLNDGTTNSGVATATITMDGQINAPTVIAQTTNLTQPVISGTFDEISADELTVEVFYDTANPTFSDTYTFSNIQTGGLPPAGMTTDGNGNWSLNLALTSTSLVSGDDTYQVDVTNVSNPGAGNEATATDTNSNEIILTSGTFVATGDVLAIGEDDGPASVAADGLLANDLLPVITDPARPGSVTDHLLAEHITLVGGSTAAWADAATGDGEDHALTLTNITRTDAPVTAYSTIGAAYQFDGATSAATVAANLFTGNLSENSATLEWWLKFDGGFGNAEEQVIADFGDQNEGFSLVYRAEATAVPDPAQGSFVLYYNDDDQAAANSIATVQLDLAGAIDPTAEFTQVAVTFDDTSNSITIYVNGGVAAGGLQLTQSVPGLDDWMRENDGTISLGAVNGQQGGIEGNTPGAASNFDGDMSSFRIYGQTGGSQDDFLSAGEVSDNYYNITATVPDGSITAVNASGANVGATIAGSAGGQFTVNADGSYTFDPNGEFENLQEGATRTTTISYTVQDGALSQTDTATLTVTVIGANDPFTTVPDADTFVLGSSGNVLGIVAPGDVDSDPTTDPISQIKITEIPADGSVMNGASAVAVNDILTLPQLQALTFDAPVAYSGPNAGTLTYEVSDGMALPVEGSFDITIDAQINLPTVDGQPTVYESTATITGTYDATNAGKLEVTIDGVTYTADDLLGAAPAPTTGLSVNPSAGTWTLNLTTAGQGLAENTYDVAVDTTKDGTALTVSDVTASELTIAYIAIPTVESQATTDTTPVVSGSYDFANGASLSVQVVATDASYTSATYTLASGVSSNGPLSQAGGTWTLDLGAGGGETLDDAKTYDVNVISQSALGTLTEPDQTAAELLVNSALGSQYLLADSIAVDADAAETTVAAPGLLVNDETGAGSILGSLSQEWDAAGDTGGNPYWTEEGLSGINWNFGTSESQSAATSNYPGITQVYSFGGAGEPTVATSTLDFSAAERAAPRTFEFWIKPDTGLAFGEYQIFEIGDDTNGFSITYQEDANNLINVDFDDAVTGTLSVDLTTAGIDATADFIQVSVSIGTGAVNLYVNGGGSSVTDNLANALGSWAGTDDAALAGTSGGREGGTATGFQGDIATVRYFGAALNQVGVDSNYTAVAQHFFVSQVDGFEVGAPATPTSPTMTEPAAGAAANSVQVRGDGGGLFTVYTDGTYKYDPDGAFDGLAGGATGTDAVTYYATDVYGTQVSTTLTATVTGVPSSPVNTVPGAQVVNEDSALAFSGGALISVTDADGDLASTQLSVSDGFLTVTLSGAATISSGANGTDNLLISGNETDINATLATLTYQGDSNYNGSDSLTVVSRDSNGIPLTDTDVVAITVNAIVDLSSADDTLTVNEDSSNNPGAVSGNDSTTSGGTLSYALGGGVSVTDGTLSFSSDGTYTYTPDAEFSGTDSFTYIVTDADSGESATQTVVITVDPLDDGVASITSGGTGSGAEDTVLGDTLVVSDPDGLAASPFAINSQGGNGTAAIDATSGVWTYSPDPNYNGTDSFTVTITDAQAFTSTVTVNVTVTPITDLTSADDVLAVGINSTNNPGSVAGNDSTTSGGTLSFALGGGVSVTDGTLVFSSDGSYTYSPDTSYIGTDSFSYVVTDADSGESATQTVTITVAPFVDDGPASATGGDSDTGDEDTVLGATLTVTDPDGLAASPFAINAQGGNGVAAIDATSGVWTYTPDANFNGTDSFTVTVTDAEAFTSTVTINLTVNPVNDLPEFLTGADVITDAPNADIYNFSSLPEGTPIGTAVGNVLAGDLDGDPITYQFAGGLTTTADGVFTIDANSGAITLAKTIVDGDVGSYALTVEVSDDGFTTTGDTATVNVDLTDVNEAPVVSSVAISVDEGTVDNALGLSAPTDGDSTPLQIKVTGLPAAGTVTLAGGGAVNVNDILTNAQLTGLEYDAPGSTTPGLLGTFTYTVDDLEGELNSTQTGQAKFIAMLPLLRKMMLRQLTKIPRSQLAVTCLQMTCYCRTQLVLKL